MFDSIDSQIPRREFAKAALAIGGANALAACTALETTEDDDGNPPYPVGNRELEELPERQHFWDDNVLVDMAGNTVLPEHQLILFFEYVGEIPPTAEERDDVERAFQSLERAYQRGTGGEIGAQANAGLLFLIGYSPSYFDRFDHSLPTDLGLQTPEEVLEAVGESPELAESYDAVMILNSDFASLLLEVESALTGEVDRVNDQEFDGSFEGILEVVERRTGFVGGGRPHAELDDPVAERIDENAPMSMGFQSGFTDNLPEMDAVTIDSGPFEDGTTLLVSQLEIELDRWYEHEHSDRIELMFSTEHTVEDVGQVGENLGDHSGIQPDHVETIEERAEGCGRIGHTTKTATARDEDFEPTIHRRSETIATDIVREGVGGFNFSSVQSDIERFIEVRQAMNPDDYDVDVPRAEHGIIDYFETTSRATFLVPPRRLRALPNPDPAMNSES